MNIKKTITKNKLELILEGKFDSISAPKFEEDITPVLNQVNDISVDLGAIEYISSAGLRALLLLQQTIDEKNGNMIIKNVPEIVQNVFSVTGFDDLINIQQ